MVMYFFMSTSIQGRVRTIFRRDLTLMRIANIFAASLWIICIRLFTLRAKLARECRDFFDLSMSCLVFFPTGSRRIFLTTSLIQST